MINVICFATPDIAIKSLEELKKDKEINLLALVTRMDKPQGRGHKILPPPAKVCALENNIPCFQTEKISKDENLISILRDLKPDFFVTFAFGQILSQEVLDIPKFAVINLHASLLPKYRGANPIQRCIYNGDKVTGITTMLTVLELDAGDICETEEIQITENMTDIELREIIADKSPKLICSTLKGLYKGILKPQKQSKDGISTAKKFVKQDEVINWNSSAKSVHNQVRSMSGRAYTFFNGKIVKIVETRLTSGKKALNSACITGVSKSGIEVNTGDGCILITKIKPESKSVMNAFDFANGAKIKTGMKFGEKICIKEE